MFSPSSSNRIRFRPLLRLLLVLLAIQVVSAVAPPLYILQGLANYAPLHTCLEVLAIVVSSLVFSVGWSVYQKEGSGNLMLLACGFLGVAVLDLLHTLSYQGMPDFVTASSPEKAIAFWLAARTMAFLALFGIGVLPNWRLRQSRHRWLMLGGVLAFVGVLIWIVLWHSVWVPRTFIQGQGLTAFKKGCEYLLIVMYLFVATYLYRNSHVPQNYDALGLSAAAVVLAMSEVFFTLYADVTDGFNLLGHLYKVVAYGLIYRAVFLDSIEIPYQRLLQSRQALAASEAKFHAIIDESPVAYLLYDEQQRINYLNPAFVATFGYNLDDLPSWSDWWRLAFPDADYRQAMINNWQYHLRHAVDLGQAFAPMELDVVCKHGDKRTVLINVALLGDALAGHQVVIMTDVSERVRAMEMIWRQAHLDPLTELPNRSLFLSKLTQEMSRTRGGSKRMALLFIDLDRFKDVNDTLGHFMGDILLKEAAQRLQKSVSSGLTLARLGGDEFTVIVGDLDEHRQVEPIARGILQSLAQPFVLGEETVYLSASIGIAFYPDDAVKSDELLKFADQAMYRAKQQGRDRYSFFTGEMLQQAKNRMRLLNELHGALEKHQFMVYYQPIVDLSSRAIYKAEALLRWRHPELGMVSPAEFVPLAEETGVIVDIGEWVFDTVLLQLLEWRRRYHPEFQISINKSPIQFISLRYDQKHWLQKMQHAGLPGQSVIVEITEGVLLDAGGTVSEQLLIFRDAGLQVALDDFGTGYSSLAYLKKFDIDFIKIDQSFVRNLRHDSSDMAVCEAIVAMARKLGIKVVAEGIETQEQLDLLIAIGCDYGQGYWFSKAVAADEFERLLDLPSPAVVGDGAV